jgi:hypothetical protein
VQAAWHGEGDVALATFDSAIIRPVDVRSQCKRFLSQADTFPLRPNPLAQFVKDFPLGHRAG